MFKSYTSPFVFKQSGNERVLTEGHVVISGDGLNLQKLPSYGTSVPYMFNMLEHIVK